MAKGSFVVSRHIVKKWRKGRPHAGLLIRRAHLIDLASGVDQIGDVRIEGERVVDIGAELPAMGNQTLDADGLCLAPA